MNRWLGMFGMLSLAAVVAWVAWSRLYPPAAFGPYGKVQAGMTEAELVAIFGRQSDRPLVSAKRKVSDTWDYRRWDASISVTVFYDRDMLVDQKIITGERFGGDLKILDLVSWETMPSNR